MSRPLFKVSIFIFTITLSGGLFLAAPNFISPQALAHGNGHGPGHNNGHGQGHHGNGHHGGGHHHRPPPIKIKALDDLEFGVIAPHTTLRGKVVVRPGSDNNSRCGQSLTCFTGGDRARFRVNARGNHCVTITLPQSTTLSNSAGHKMRVNKFKMNASGFGNGIGFIQGNGATQIGVGATLHVKPNQPPGAYTGTFEINASFQ